MRCLICLLLLCALFTGVHAADAIDNQIEQIRTLAQAENVGRATLDLLEEISTAVGQVKYDDALQQTNDLLKDPLPSDLKDALQKFSTALIQEQSKQSKDRAAKASAFMAKIADTCWRAKKPSDLTAIGIELRAFEIGSPANPGVPQEETSTLEQFLSTWSQYLTVKQGGDIRNALNNLNNIQNNEGFRPIISLFPKDGISELRIQVRDDAAKSVTDELDHLSDEIAHAKTARDLNVISAKFEAMRGKADAEVIGSPAASRYNRDQNALNNWINLVAAEETGDLDQALKRFSDFLTEPGDIIPPNVLAAKRSALFLETIDQPAKKFTPASIETFSQKLDAVKKPDQLDALVASLEVLHQAGFQNNESDLLPLEIDLTSLVKQWRYLNDGRFDGFWNFESDLASHPWTDKVAAMRKNLAVQALDRQFEIKLDSSSIQSVPKALDAALKQSIAQGDWAKTGQILLTMNRYLTTTGGNTDSQADTLKAVHAYIEGLNSEQGGQWTDAIVSYREVLRHDGPYVPRQPAIDHLKKLQAEHPEAFPKPKAPE